VLGAVLLGSLLTASPLSPGSSPVAAPWLAQTQPRIAFGGGVILVVWVDDRSGPDERLRGTLARESDLYGARIINGAIVDQAGFRISSAPGVQRDPTVTFDGTNFVVAWADTRAAFVGTGAYGAALQHVYFARVTLDGGVLDPDGRKVTPGATLRQLRPAVASQGGQSLLVWHDDRGGGALVNPANGADIVGARITTAGGVLDPTGFTVCGSPGLQAAPALCAGDGGWHLTWRDEQVGSQAFYAWVSSAAAVAPSNGAAVSGPAGSSSELRLADVGGVPLLGWINGGSSIVAPLDPSRPSTNPNSFMVASIADHQVRGGVWGRVATTMQGTQNRVVVSTRQPNMSWVSEAIVTPQNASGVDVVELATGAAHAVWQDYRLEGAAPWWEAFFPDVYDLPLGGPLDAGRLLSKAGATQISLATVASPAGPIVQVASCTGLTCDLAVIEVGSGNTTNGITGVLDHGLAKVGARVFSIARRGLDVMATSGLAPVRIASLENRTLPLLVVDDVVLWVDDRPSGNAFVEILDATGNPTLATDAGGRAIFAAPFVVDHAFARSGPDGGFLYAWIRNDTAEPSLNLFRLRPDLAPLDLGPIDLAPRAGRQKDPAVTGTGSGYYVAWADFRDGGSSIFGSSLREAVGPSEVAPRLLYRAPDYVARPAVIASGPLVLVAWEEYRTGSGWDIGGLEVLADGGLTAPRVVVGGPTDDRAPVWLPAVPPQLAFSRYRPDQGVFRIFIEADAGFLVGVTLDAGPGLSDGGASDAGAPDAGAIDAGVDPGVDAGADAGTDAGLDPGLDDAGQSVDGGADGGGPDASVTDSGVDAGPDDAGIAAGADAGVLSDGGALPRERLDLAVGCGCASVEPFGLIAFLLLLIRRGAAARFRGSSARGSP